MGDETDKGFAAAETLSGLTLHRRSHFWLWVYASAFLALVLTILLFYVTLPNPSVLKTQYVHIVYDPVAEKAKAQLVKNRPNSWVPLSQISQRAIGAVIVSEDWAFYSHSGYDLEQIWEAFDESIKEGRWVRGASTITQQVAKNVFLQNTRSFWRKLRELAIAVQMEGALSKKRILEIYLNIAEWGRGIFGIGEASRHYFHKAPSELTAKEGAFLAMLLPSPKRYSESFRKKELTGFAEKTVNAILHKMVRGQFITEEQRLVLAQQPLSFESLKPSSFESLGYDSLPEEEEEVKTSPEKADPEKEGPTISAGAPSAPSDAPTVLLQPEQPEKQEAVPEEPAPIAPVNPGE